MYVRWDLYVGKCVFYFLFVCCPVCFSVVCVSVTVLYELVICLCVVGDEDRKVVRVKCI